MTNPGILPSLPFASKEELAYEALKEAIITGKLKPGDSLIQTELAQTLGISPIPIRSAITRLAAEGLVLQESYRSPRVSELSTEGLEEILLIRMNLEVLAARYAFPRIQERELQELQILVDKMGETLETAKHVQHGKLNREFHHKLIEPCPLPLLKQMISDLWANSDRYQTSTRFAMLPNYAEQAQDEHKEILRLIGNGECDAAVELLDQHKRRARAELYKFLEASS